MSDQLTALVRELALALRERVVPHLGSHAARAHEDELAAGGDITFAQTVNGAFGLTAKTQGTTTFNGSVGNTTALASVTTDAGHLSLVSRAPAVTDLIVTAVNATS